MGIVVIVCVMVMVVNVELVNALMMPGPGVHPGPKEEEGEVGQNVYDHMKWIVRVVSIGICLRAKQHVLV